MKMRYLFDEIVKWFHNTSEWGRCTVTKLDNMKIPMSFKSVAAASKLAMKSDMQRILGL